MLRILLTAFALLVYTFGHAQNDAISTYFAQYVDDERFTAVFVSGKMFDLMESVVANLDTEDMTNEQVTALRDVVVDMQALRILTSDDSTTSDLYFDAKKKFVDGSPYSVLMTVRDKDRTNVDFYVRDDGGEVVNELLLLVRDEGQNFTMLSFEGRIDLTKIGALSKAFDDGDGFKDKD